MTRLVFHHPDDDPFTWTVGRIREALRNQGYEISYEDAKRAWEAYSESMAAGWMVIPDDDAEILACVRSYLREDE
jgi:hypothetical protein